MAYQFASCNGAWLGWRKAWQASGSCRRPRGVKYVLSDNSSPALKDSPCEDTQPPEIFSTFLQMLPSPEASLRLTVSECSDRFALLTAQKVERSWQLERLPRLTEGSPVSPLMSVMQVNAGSFLFSLHTSHMLGPGVKMELDLTFNPPFCSRQCTFLNKQHGAEKSFTFLSLSVSGAATCVRLLCDCSENCWPRYCAVLCVSTKEPVEKNSFINSLFSLFVSLSPVVFRSLVVLWVVDRWTWAFLVYINLIFLFGWTNIQNKPARIGLLCGLGMCKVCVYTGSVDSVVDLGTYNLGSSLIWL